MQYQFTLNVQAKYLRHITKKLEHWWFKERKDRKIMLDDINLRYMQGTITTMWKLIHS